MSEIPTTPEDNDPSLPDMRKIPPSVVKRLSLYARVLQSMEFANADKVSSAELASRLGLNSAQVRKDLAFFGQFGVPGFGYPIVELRRHLRLILGKDREVKVILLGVGNLGSALLSYGGFMKQGFTLLWGFDSDPVAARLRSRSSVPIYDVANLEDQLADRQVDIAVLAVPVEVAQETADRVVNLGVTAILNFVPVRLEVPPHVQLRYVDLSLELESLSYYVRD